MLPSKVAQFEDQASRFGISILSHAGNGTVIGKLAEDAGNLSRAAEILSPLSELASRCGGYLVLLRGDPRWKAALPVGGSPADSRALMRKLKQAFDPEDLLNPGRMFPIE